MARPELEVNAVNEYGATALVTAILQNNNEAVRALLSREDIDVNIGDHKTGRTALMLLAAKDETLPFLTRFIPDQEQRESLVKATRAIEILNLSYSMKSVSSDVIMVNDILVKAISELSFPQQPLFQEAAEKIKQGEFILSGAENKKFRVMPSPLGGHCAYFLIEYNNNHPVKLSYIDGNCPLSSSLGKYKYIEVKFEVDANKISDENLSSPEAFESYLRRVFVGPYIEGTRNKKEFTDRLLGYFSQVVTCESESGTPIIISESTPVTPQANTNCAFKSFNGLERVILQKLYPEEMDFSYLAEDINFNYFGNVRYVGGPSVQAYKEYKNALVGKFFNDLSEVVEKEQRFRVIQGEAYEKPIWYDRAIQTLQQCLAQAKKKHRHSLQKGNEEFAAQHLERHERIENFLQAGADQSEGLFAKIMSIFQREKEHVQNSSVAEEEKRDAAENQRARPSRNPKPLSDSTERVTGEKRRR